MAMKCNCHIRKFALLCTYYRSTSSIALAWILTAPLVTNEHGNIRSPWKITRSSSNPSSMEGYGCALSAMRHFATSFPSRAPAKQTRTTSTNSAIQSLFASEDDGGTTTNPSTVTHYFTCRHDYENSLMEELMITQQQPINVGNIWTDTAEGSTKMNATSDTYQRLIRVSSPYPGLVKAEYKISNAKTTTATGDNDSSRGSFLLDPVYALQILPNSMEISGTSIRELAKKAISALTRLTVLDSSTTKVSTQQKLLSISPRGSLTIHALVPDMFKGNPKPKMQRRVNNIANEIKDLLAAMYPCARKYSALTNTIQDCTTQHIDNDAKNYPSNWHIECILQLLLLTPEYLVLSLSPVQHGTLYQSMSWPCVPFTAGLANAEEDTLLHHSLIVPNRCWQGGAKTTTTNTMTILNNNPAPSSAYRKLIEALSCMGITTIPHGSTAIDLGASPGGWTSVLRKLGFQVIAVDRALLHPNISKDENVTFISGDAFAYLPPTTATPVLLMVSDIVAYPERVVNLLDKWCSLRLATTMIVTMKFKGNTPAWDELRKSKEVAHRNGYSFRAKHFFNNKNEVTLMLATSNFNKAEFHVTTTLNCVSIFQPTSMYEITLPSR